MTVLDVLLDTSWSIQYVPKHRPSSEALKDLITTLSRSSKAQITLQRLSEECQNYIISRGRTQPRDELNDTTEKTGSLRECTLSPLHSHSSAGLSEVIGLAIESKYQKTTFRVVLLTGKNLSERSGCIPVVLYKGNQSQVNVVKDWLYQKFQLPVAEMLQLPSQLLLQLCSRYLSALSSSWPVATDHTDALRQAMLKQVIGNLKLTMAFSTASAKGVAPDLKTMDFDIPAESVNVLLNKAQKSARGKSDLGDKFLDELRNGLRAKTGLILPLTTTSTDTDDVRGDPPLRVTKVSCAAFALSLDGRIKLASKPIENAQVTGYDEVTVREVDLALLDMIVKEAERRALADG